MESQTAGETSRSGSRTQTPSQTADGGGGSHLAAAIHTSLPDGTRNQASCQSLTMNSGSEDHPDLGPEMPSENHEDANASQSGATAEQYVPWFVVRSYGGILPRVLLSMVSVFGLLLLIALMLLILIDSPFLGDDVTVLMRHLRRISTYGLNFCIGGIYWMPVIWVPMYLSAIHPAKKISFWITIIICAIIFGLLILANCVSTSSLWISRAWLLESWPQSFHGCDVRVQPKQSLLFTPDIYHTQFARSSVGDSDNKLQPPYWFNMSVYHSVQMNQTLCEQGFTGNSDLYGLGIRVGIYLQWTSSLLANNLLPENRQELQKIYLVFSLAICIATVVLSFTNACIFSIEIELLYWMYWGGFVCVFASSPCSVRLGKETKWIGLDWITMCLYTTHLLMTYHGIWFVWYAYDQVFSRMPCGTYQFYLVPMLDPSESFWGLRDVLTKLLAPLAAPLLLGFPFVGFLLASEIKQSIQHSAIYQMVFPTSNHSDSRQSQDVGSDASAQTSLGIRVYLRIKRLYREFRKFFLLPAPSRRGIRLVTPIDVRNRRKYRIRCAALGLVSCVLSITAIEFTLKWNKVVGIYSLTSVGQYVPFIIGAGGLISICWQLAGQESTRRRDLRRRRAVSEATDGTELQPISTTLSQAISHALGQPDVTFLTNGGALPTTSDHQDGDPGFSE